MIERKSDLIVGDSAEPRLIADLNKKGLNIKPTKKYAGVVSASILKMLEYKIIVSPESHNLKKELRNYAWSNKKAGIPEDKNNHLIDALRYAFLELEEPIRNNLNNLASFL